MSVHEVWPNYPEWVERYESGLHVPENFTADEWLYLGGAHNDPDSPRYGVNTYPPKKLWNGCLILNRYLVQEVRTEFGSPIFLSSNFRSKKYNRMTPGAVPGSYHTKFLAADCFPLNGDVQGLWEIADRIVGHRGGVGRYHDFVHIDSRGYKARW